APRATTNIQHASAHIFHCRLLMPRPVLEFREVKRRATRRIKPAIIALDDFPGGLAVKIIPHDPAIGVLLFRQHSAPSLRQWRTDTNWKNLAARWRLATVEAHEPNLRLRFDQSRSDPACRWLSPLVLARALSVPRCLQQRVGRRLQRGQGADQAGQ